MTASVPTSPVQPATAQPPPNTRSARLRAALRTLRWSYGDLAAELGKSQSAVAKWCDGTNPVPRGILPWVERLAAFHRALPAPGRE